jgi:hypothetical protein
MEVVASLTIPGEDPLQTPHDASIKTRSEVRHKVEKKLAPPCVLGEERSAVGQGWETYVPHIGTAEGEPVQQFREKRHGRNIAFASEKLRCRSPIRLSMAVYTLRKPAAA